MIYTLILFIFSLFPLLIGNDGTKSHAHLLLIAFGIIGIISINQKKDYWLYFTPNSLIFLYSIISLIFGAWGYANGYVIPKENLLTYESWTHADASLTIILLSLATLLAVDKVFHNRYLGQANREMPRATKWHLLATSILAPFFFLSVDLSALGGSGDLSLIPKSAFAFVCILYFSKLPTARRWLAYFAIIVSFATFSIHEKRDAIFLIFPMLYLEFLNNGKKISIKLLLLYTLVGALTMILILTMSVARGYGGTGEHSNLISAAPLILTYMNSDMFIAGLLNNIEANYFYFHGLNSINMVLNEPLLISLGSTLIKPIFIFVPRDLVAWKPESIISLYTTAHDPAFRAAGGSLPISIFSELFWNFHLAGLAFTGFFAAIMARLHIFMLNQHRNNRIFLFGFSLYAYMNIITLSRGSGFDLYFMYVLFAGISFLACSIVYSILNVKHRTVSSLQDERASN